MVAAVLAAAVTAVPKAAEAGSVLPTSKKVIGGFATVNPCGAVSGIGVAWTSTGGAVTSVDLSAIPSTCIGGSLSLTLQGSGGSALGSIGPLVITGTSQTLAVGATASSVVSAAISVTGP